MHIQCVSRFFRLVPAACGRQALAFKGTEAMMERHLRTAESAQCIRQYGKDARDVRTDGSDARRCCAQDPAAADKLTRIQRDLDETKVVPCPVLLMLPWSCPCGSAALWGWRTASRVPYNMFGGLSGAPGDASASPASALAAG